MLHQVTLELIKQEVDMDSHRMSHGIEPGEKIASRQMAAFPYSCFNNVRRYLMQY